MRNIWIAIALGMSVLMTGLGAWKAQAVNASSLAGLGTLSKQNSSIQKAACLGLVAAASGSIAFATAGAAGVDPACKISDGFISTFGAGLRPAPFPAATSGGA